MVSTGFHVQKLFLTFKIKNSKIQINVFKKSEKKLTFKVRR